MCIDAGDYAIDDFPRRENDNEVEEVALPPLPPRVVQRNRQGRIVDPNARHAIVRIYEDRLANNFNVPTAEARIARRRARATRRAERARRNAPENEEPNPH